MFDVGWWSDFGFWILGIMDVGYVGWLMVLDD
jgi:hypothetical protein